MINWQLKSFSCKPIMIIFDQQSENFAKNKLYFAFNYVDSSVKIRELEPTKLNHWDNLLLILITVHIYKG